ncbi:extracellular solute-binding protein, family protein 5 [Mycobacterium lentiflavum]|uniref:ABC transporter substrate-binding protein n=1 Tax=Mycobacterium lentiflavum TaxID=141349 RepID=A0A0E3WC56_MYCLN|nr:ABC transporter substrate-binding protein [Mycobacterium lentiflavum]MEE3066197.1 ABC transporter substrate-binding protein [Actinomycetota bacterium]ULP44342.1 ABC transporter substrate-binding protein [Mycobacterium lentiflavum]CQD12296.1 extracellular solute-binding protein, family protein 5 [Mycobacterium lentiflavum]
MLRRAAAVSLTVALAVTFVVTGCSGSAASQIDYVVDGRLSTYNANTTVGFASAGAQAFARTLTGFGYHGPDGQVVADHDFGSVTVVSGSPLVLDYQIADNAVYSDGKPLTCDDMVLAWAAQSGRFPGFDAATQAGYADIANIECIPGQKKARVSFVPDRGVVDYNQLFAATTMMPSHVIADQLNIDVTATLLGNNAQSVAPIAQLWNTTWDLKPGLKHDEIAKRFPSSGPYKIESVLDDGAVVLVANDRWWGPKAITKRITVSAQGPDIQDRVNNRSVDVVDVAAGSSGALNTPDNYERTDSAAAGIEQLIFAPQGPLAQNNDRRTFALCVPRDVIARDAGVPIANSRLSPVAEDAVAQADGAAEASPYNKPDPVAARAALGGAPLAVRIGYQGPNARLAVTVGTITKSCAAAGINVSNVTLDTSGPQALRDGKIDVLLASTGGASGSGSTGSSSLDAYDLHSGNGNNLSGYANPQVDGIIGALAVSGDPAERVRLLAEGAPVLWGDMPTLPLYRQQRTLLMSKKMYAVSANPTRWGAGWNMDRWALMQ